MIHAFAVRHVRKIAFAAGWAALLIIVASTLSPMQLRPRSLLPVNMERGFAFANVGIAFALASPKRPLFLLALLIACAGALEWMQTMSPGRHGQFMDFVVKSLGVDFGVTVATLANRWIDRNDRVSR
jgi:VanZ family protein